MSYDIVIRFPDKKVADEFCGQMSDGAGEGICDFSVWEQLPDTDGSKQKHYRKVVDELGRPVCFVTRMEEF